MVDVVGRSSVEKVRGKEPVYGEPSGEGESPQVDSGLSSIEKSKAVRPEVVPPMSGPVLSAPTASGSGTLAVASTDGSGKPTMEMVTVYVSREEDEIKNNMLEQWIQNMRDIEEYVRQMLNSPAYLQLQERQRQEAAHSVGLSGASIGGIAGASSASASPSPDTFPFLSTLDRLQVLGTVPSTAKVPEPAAPGDASRLLLLPLTAALFAGGVVGGTELAQAAVHPLSGVFEMVQQLQPIFSHFSMADLIPVINLMAVGPIYYHSWNEAVSRIKERGRHSYVETAQNFAKDVVKMVADPDFVRGILMARMKGSGPVSPQDQERLTCMLKVVLIGTALSLLYSVEVGKVQKDTFGGIEPEELRELLLGKWARMPSAGKKLSVQEELTISLVKLAQGQLSLLSPEDRMRAVEMLFDYATKTREFNPMLDPVKVFDEALTSSAYDPKEKGSMAV